MIPQHIIQQIRQEANTDIVDIISPYVPLKKQGRDFKGVCPFHADTKPSMSVSESRGMYKCFVCGEGGDALDFLIKHTHKEFLEVVRDLANRYHIDLEETRHKVEYKTENYIPTEELLPGIGDMKARIRQAGYVILFFREEDLASFTDSEKEPWLLVSHPLNSRQVNFLKRITKNAVFRVQGGKEWSELFDSIRGCIQEGIAVSILTDDCAPTTEKDPFSKELKIDLDDWLSYVINHFPATEEVRRQIVRTIASIEENLLRSIYKKEFFTQWDEKLTPRFD